MYPYEVKVVEILELIIGQEKMTSMYFNNDLQALVEELTKYQDITKIKHFIADLDTINKIMMTKLLSNRRKLLLDLEYKITIFLRETFKNKEAINNENKELSQEEFSVLEKEMIQNSYSRYYSIFYYDEKSHTKNLTKLNPNI